MDYYYVDNYIQKRGCLHLPVRCSRPTTALQKEQTEKQPRWSIQTTVKCALRIPDPRSTLRRVYTTLHGVTPAFVLVLHIDCGSFDGSKNKASVTPFNK